MKSSTTIGAMLLLSLVSNETLAQDEFIYLSALETRFLVAQLTSEPEGACGYIDFDATRVNTQGIYSVDAEDQQTALMVEPIPDLVCRRNFNAKQVIVARDRISIQTNAGGLRGNCESRLTLDVPGYESNNVPGWAEALQLVYGGVNGEGDETACSAPARRDLINNWSKLWKDKCADGKSKCSKLRFAYRHGDDESITRAMMKILGIKQYCNGTQAQDNDPIRTDCASAEDVDWCPDGNLGVVQPISLFQSGVGVFPRFGCAEGNFEYGFNTSAACVDDTPPFAGFLCLYPRSCRNQFGCVNNINNTSPFNPGMDGRRFNYPQYNDALEPEPIKDTVSPVSVYMSGRCSAGRNGNNTGLQVGCLIRQTSCSLGMNASEYSIVGTTLIKPGPQCAVEAATPARIVYVNDQEFAKTGPGYPLSRPLYLNATQLDVKDGVLDCDQVVDENEKKLCKCVFNKTLLDGYLVQGIKDPVPEYKLLDCGAYE